MSWEAIATYVQDMNAADSDENSQGTNAADVALWHTSRGLAVTGSVDGTGDNNGVKVLREHSRKSIDSEVISGVKIVAHTQQAAAQSALRQSVAKQLAKGKGSTKELLSG
jgi:hypothetical protein